MTGSSVIEVFFHEQGHDFGLEHPFRYPDPNNQLRKVGDNNYMINLNDPYGYPPRNLKKDQTILKTHFNQINFIIDQILKDGGNNGSGSSGSKGGSSGSEGGSSSGEEQPQN